MALKKCEECGKEISTKAASCPGCGAPVKPSGPKHKSGRLTPTHVPQGLGCLVFAVIVCVWHFGSTNNSRKGNEKPNIPDDVSYSIIDSDTMLDIKRSLV